MHNRKYRYWKKDNSLIIGGASPTYIVKKEEKDKKKRFSRYKLELKPHIDTSYPEIKKAGRSQTNQDIEVEVVNNNCPSTNIKAKKKKNYNKRR